MGEMVSVPKAYLDALEREHEMGTQLLATKVLNADFRVVGDWINARNEVFDLRPEPPTAKDVLREWADYYRDSDPEIGTPTFRELLEKTRAILAAHDKENA